jgi:hypothetical protein
MTDPQPFWWIERGSTNQHFFFYSHNNTHQHTFDAMVSPPNQITNRHNVTHAATFLLFDDNSVWSHVEFCCVWHSSSSLPRAGQSPIFLLDCRGPNVQFSRLLYVLRQYVLSIFDCFLFSFFGLVDVLLSIRVSFVLVHGSVFVIYIFWDGVWCFDVVVAAVP